MRKLIQSGHPADKMHQQMNGNKRVFGPAKDRRETGRQTNQGEQNKDASVFIRKRYVKKICRRKVGQTDREKQRRIKEEK
jgi:hypothetical protein